MGPRARVHELFTTPRAVADFRVERVVLEVCSLGSTSSALVRLVLWVTSPPPMLALGEMVGGTAEWIMGSATATKRRTTSRLWRTLLAVVAAGVLGTACMSSPPPDDDDDGGGSGASNGSSNASNASSSSVATSGSGAGGPGGDATLVVQNYSSNSVFYLYLSPCGSGSWGSDILGSNIISSETQATVTDISPGCYDFRAETSTDIGIAWETFGVDMPSGHTYTWQLVD
jgi:hypothetical protein